MRSIQFLLLLIASACFASPAIAQTGDFDFDFQAGVTPAEVRKIYSAKASIAAYETNLDGRVSVRVSIDAAGNVSSVENISGPGNICQSVKRPDVIAARDAAANAARLVKFKPAKVGDQPIASAGWLYFDIAKRSVSVPDDASTDDGGPLQTIDHFGPLQGKARSLPKPLYPPAARAVRASGPVSVKVLIDTDGNAFSSEAISGHPLLRTAARNAACGSNFSPILLSGQPVKVYSIITYNFVP